MLTLTSRIRPLWPLLTLLISASMLAMAHLYFQRFLGLQPCPLCLDQRNWHWGVVALSAVSLIAVRIKPGLVRWAAALIGLVLFGSFAQAAYHVAVEHHWVTAQCDVRTAAGQSLTFDLNAPLQVPQCDQIAWQMFGISMAGYNALISLALALSAFAVALLPERKA